MPAFALRPASSPGHPFLSGASRRAPGARSLPAILGTLVALAALATAMPLRAQQDYPSRPIRYVTMFPPGSATDLAARFVTAGMSEQLGVPFVIDAKPGGSGIIAIRDVLRAQPLGYSVLQTNPALVNNLFSFKEPGYKLEDYTPVGVLGHAYYIVMLNQNKVPVKSLQELVAWGKANKGMLNYGSLGTAAPPTLYAERFNLAAGLDMVGINYKGGDPAGLALVAGDIQVYWATQSTTRQRTQSPGIIPLAVVAEERTKMFPQVPTFRELGYPQLTDGAWTAAVMPANVPAHMLARLREAYARASAKPEWQAQMEKMEFTHYTGTLEAFRARLRQDAVQVGEVFRVLKLPQE